MTQRQTIVRVCDFCGSDAPNVETKTLVLDGKTTEAESCPKCWSKVGKAITEFVDKGRHVPRRNKRRTPAAT